ncbi:hypothetical protein TGPRC2_305510 [Toxoplasma gondii TgCatPRC2]|uniref:Uncharacterized protein n=9 Tax=Toxoplasma gondii TaxID=5811 RepID=B9QM74_TOXGV|nr:hypothetical protein TGVEG_305510 [Toxoplasma gondii VEG]KFG28479.1 hypothetical protein TGP89_305510 [Toxoplasma gondii p89]KFG59274.1 hypothetical protein TGRUB_305510 [Toxoplasma gondii RUB]KFH02611.1 hypothetical protein TGVAND_305510 [Toxoplasma gondii VAND]KFH07141.1 hypothetical protein TGMAS_305510 [Toxoplasma gondii MAS]KYF44773.1 hypothetical protein TGARI_305510 [Toxoplasma gondii ARI]KYK64573.1 hypothetical protein TGPRC2_305510 [Toxoplasma gondii TgCatPRC2]PIL97068.1 hypothet
MAVAKLDGKTLPALRLALCGEGNAVTTWWAAMLLQSAAFEVVAAWSRDKSESLDIAQALTANGKGTVNAYWEKTGDLSGIGTRPGSAVQRAEAGETGLDALLQRDDVDAFILVLPEDSHTIVLGEIFQKCPRKHVFSANLPSFNPSIMKHLISLYNTVSLGPSQGSETGRRPGVWSACSVFKHEVAVCKLQAILKDLGPIVSGELIATSMMQNVTVTSAGSFGGKRAPRTAAQQRELLSAVCSAYSGLLRHLLGDLDSLSAVRGSSATLCGQMHFQRGANVAVTVDLLSKTNMFSFTIWGIKGFGRLTWDEEKKAFEVQRYLHHYEHPTLHPVTGPTWSVKQWVETIWHTAKREGIKESNPQKPEFMLVDLVTSTAMVDSDGGIVRLCATPQSRPDTNAQSQRVSQSRREDNEVLAAA